MTDYGDGYILEVLGWDARARALRAMESLTRRFGVDAKYLDTARRFDSEDDNSGFTMVAADFFEACAMAKAEAEK